MSAAVVDQAAKPRTEYGVDPAVFMQRYANRGALNPYQVRERVVEETNASKADHTADKIVGQLEMGPLTVYQLAKLLEMPPTTVQSALWRLAAAGDVTGGGRRQPWKVTH